MKIKNNIFRLIISCFIFLVIGCTHPIPNENLVPAKSIVERENPIAEIPSHADFLSNQSPEIKKAFERYEKTGHAPIIKNEEFLEFPFDTETQPIINCQPLRACDIELSNDEHITGIFSGDSSRWLYQEAVSGEKENIRPHVIFKPKDWDISTDVIITTSQRTYHLSLISDRNHYVRHIKFYYPEVIAHQSQQAFKVWQQNKSDTIALLPNINLEKIDDNYRIKTNTGFFGSKPAFFPTRVFNVGGQHVFIEMPQVLALSDAPALFVINQDGEKSLVNYRVHERWYVVDNRFQQAVLISGTGRNQQRVTITYQG